MISQPVLHTGFFNIDNSVCFHGLNITNFCCSYRVQNTLDPHKLQIKDTHLLVCRRMKLYLLHSCHLSLCNSSEAGLTYNFSAPVGQMTSPCPLQYWGKTHRLKQKSGGEGRLWWFPSSTLSHLYPEELGFTPLKGYFSCHLRCTPGNSQHRLIMSSSGITHWIWVGCVWYAGGGWVSDNVCIQLLPVSVYIIRIASYDLDAGQYLVFRLCLNKQSYGQIVTRLRCLIFNAKYNFLMLRIPRSPKN